MHGRDGENCHRALAGLALASRTHRAPPRPGVKTPGVKIPIERLKPEAVFPVPGTPDWLAIDEAVWVSNKPKDSVSRLDPKTNTVAATIQRRQAARAPAWRPASAASGCPTAAIRRCRASI